MRVHQVVSVSSLVGLLFGLGCTGTSGTNTVFPVVHVDPTQLEAPLSFRLSPGRSVQLQSEVSVTERGQMTLRVISGSVDRETSLTLARYRKENTPVGVVGAAFVLSPEVLTLARPMRIRIALPRALVKNLSQIRLARLDTDGRFYEPLSVQAVIEDGDVVIVAGESERFGVFGVVDSALSPIRNDIGSTPLARALHLMDLGEAGAARDEFSVAYAANGGSTAGFGWALTRLFALPALPAVTSFLSTCGYPTYSLDKVFGSTGYFARESQRGKAQVDLRLGQGFDADNVVEKVLQPALVMAELQPEPTCYAPEVAGHLAAGHLELLISDPNIDGKGGGLDIKLGLDPDAPIKGESGSLASLLAGGAVVEIPVHKLNGYVEGRRDSDDDYSNSATGVYKPLGQNTGVVRIHQFGSALGDVVEVEFEQVLLTPTWIVSPPQVLVLNGWMSPVLSQPVQSELPFVNDERTWGQQLAGCTVAISEAYLTSMLTAVAAELTTIGDLMASSATAADFEFEVSLGLFDQPGALVVGRAEVQLLAALTRAVSAASELVGQYHWFTGDVRSLLTTGTLTQETDCNACTDQCTQVDEQVQVISAFLISEAINPVFLTPVGNTLNLVPMRQHLDVMLDRLAVVAVSGTPRGAISFNRSAARDGAAALLRLIEVVRAGLTATTETAAARLLLPTDDGVENIFLKVGKLFSTPPTQASVRADAEAEPTDVAFAPLADEDYCSEPCTNPYYLSVWPEDWLFDGLSTYFSTGDISCSDNTACNFVVGGTCGSENECIFPAPSPTDIDKVLDLLGLESDQPVFINQASINDAEAVLSF